MRAPYILLLITATLLAGSDFVSATATGPTNLAAVASTDAVESIDSALFNDYTKRSLRTHKAKEVIDEDEEEDTDEDDDSADEEERVNASKLRQYLERDDIAYTKFGKWAKRKKPFTPTDFYNKYVMADEKWRPIYNSYFNWYKTKKGGY
ncbi:hypothetical protein PHYBOEH_009404 [Phytophthora boehmeriae]|uniref:RxLR effector protein n=1 Tax=Phytophthora boehmeriae TaxID=109152 RepID=A0A8T1VWI1_9STRA|nr:hypothetical protein PHYBOEH_009404 [Phytophthora boehmeriae]